MKTGMNFGEFFEKKIVVGHGVKHARRGEDDAVGGAEDGDEDSERDEFAGPWAEYAGSGSGGDGVACSGGRGTECDEVGDIGDEIEGDEK